MNPFQWLRAKAKAAFLGGIEDAMSELAPKAEVPQLTAAPVVPELEAGGEEEQAAPKTKARGKERA